MALPHPSTRPERCRARRRLEGGRIALGGGAQVSHSTPTRCSSPSRTSSCSPLDRAGDLVRRRDVRALARRTRRGERGQGRVHDGLRRAATRALHEGRRNAAEPSRPGEPIGIRADSAWNVPEPEIGVVLGTNGRIAGYTIGNDVSSRDIEGANPLYLPQAKIYAGACSFGPAVFVTDERRARRSSSTLRVTDEWGASSSRARRRRPACGAASPSSSKWLLVDNPVPPGSVLLTGTGLVPPDDFTLLPGHIVEIHVPEIGTLVNPVVRASELHREGARPMTETLTGAPARNYVAGEWRESAARRDLREAQPVAAVGRHRRLPGLDRRGRARRDRGRAGGLPGVVRPPGRAARGVLHEGRGRDRGARRAGRAGHDRRDGQAAARGAPGGAARGRDPPLRGGRGMAADRRDVRAVGRRPAPVHASADRSASSG